MKKIQTATAVLAIILILAVSAAASTKTFTVAKDSTFTTKITKSPDVIKSKESTNAFKDRIKFTVPRYFSDPNKAVPSFGSKKFGNTQPKYLTGPRVNVAGTSKLTPVKPKYEQKPVLPTQRSVKTLQSFGSKLSSNTVFPAKTATSYTKLSANFKG